MTNTGSSRGWVPELIRIHQKSFSISSVTPFVNVEIHIKNEQLENQHGTLFVHLKIISPCLWFFFSGEDGQKYHRNPRLHDYIQFDSPFQHFSTTFTPCLPPFPTKKGIKLAIKNLPPKQKQNKHTKWPHLFLSSKNFPESFSTKETSTYQSRSISRCLSCLKHNPWCIPTVGRFQLLNNVFVFDFFSMHFSGLVNISII